MPRTIKEIQNEILFNKQNEPALNSLDSNSKVAVWRLWVYLVAVAIYKLETIFDYHKKEVNFYLSEFKSHTLRWYRNKALAFQYGFDLVEESDEFKNEGFTEEEIEASKIIKYSAVTEAEKESRLIVKIATEKDNVLNPVSVSQFNSFTQYMNEIKDAGVKITIINYLPDRLKLNLTIVRDKLVLNESGLNILDGNFPVNDTINNFLKRLPFNGELSLQKLEAEILAIEGVEDLSLNIAESAWIDANSNSYGNYQPINISEIPVSGYYTVNFNEDTPTKSTVKYV